jgi:hypothetical protein
MGTLTTSFGCRLSLMARPAQRLQVAVVVCPAVGFGFDVVNGGCGHRLAVSQALLADVPITLQDSGADDVPLTAVSSLVSALSSLVLLPALIAVVITITGAIGSCLRAAKLSACARDC